MYVRSVFVKCILTLYKNVIKREVFFYCCTNPQSKIQYDSIQLKKFFIYLIFFFRNDIIIAIIYYILKGVGTFVFFC